MILLRKSHRTKITTNHIYIILNFGVFFLHNKKPFFFSKVEQNSWKKRDITKLRVSFSENKTKLSFKS